MTTSELDKMEGIQHRMSKKIAQLTKVIYHLNNKNEDHEYDLQDVENQYESEIQSILQDTASKLNRFQAELRTKNDNQRVNQVTRKLEEEHARQIRAYEDEIHRLREKSMTVKKQFEHQVSQLMNELQHVKGEFTARLLEFKAIVQKVEENSVADAKDKVLGLEYALKKSKEEMETALQSSQNKYTEMLAERTTKEEELMAKIRVMADQIQQSDSKHKEKLDAMAEEHQAQMALEKKRLADASDKFALQTKELEAEWKGKVESLIDQLEVEKEKARAEMTRAEEALARIESNQADSSALQSSAQEEMSQLRQKVQSLTSDIEKLREESEKEKKNLAESLGSDVGQVTEKLNASLLARDKLMKDLNEASGDLKITRENLKTLQGTIEKLNSEASARDNKIRSLEDQQKKDASDCSALKKQLETTKETMKNEKIKFNRETESKVKELSELKQKLSLAEKSAGKTADAAKDTLKKEMARRLEATHEEYRKKMAEKEKNFKQQMEQSRKDAAKKLAQSEDLLRAQMAEMKKKLDSDLVSAKKKYELECSQVAETGQVTENELKKEISDLMLRLGEEQKLKKEELNTCSMTQKRLQQELADSNQKNAQLGDKIKAAQNSEYTLKQKMKDLQASEKEAQELFAKSQKSQKELQRNLADLKEEKQAQSEKAKQRLAKELSNLDKEWSKRAEIKCKEAMEETIVLHKKEMQQLQGKLEAQSQEEMRSLEEELERKKANLEIDLKTEIGTLENDLLDEKAQHKKDVQVEKENAEEMRKDADQKHKDELAGLLSKFQAEKENMKAGFAGELKTELQSAMDARLASEKDLKAAHDEEVCRMQSEMGRAASEHRATLEATVGEWSQKVSDQATSLDEKHTGELKDLQKKLSDDFFSQIQEADKKHQVESKRLRKEAEERAREISDQGKEITAFKDLTNNLKSDVSALEGANSSLQDKMVEESQNAAMALEDLRQSHEKENADVSRSHQSSIEALLLRHEETLSKHISESEEKDAEQEERFANLASQYEELNTRFQARESREDDLALIEDLQAAMAKKDEVLADTLEKMKVLKIELLNREESYNKNFANGGSAPTKASSQQDAVLSWMLKSKKESRIASARKPVTTRRASTFM